MQSKPQSAYDMPAKRLGNEEKFSIDPKEAMLRLDWKKIGDGVTLETFDIGSAGAVVRPFAAALGLPSQGAVNQSATEAIKGRK